MTPVPTKPDHYWVRPVDRLEDNVWQPCRLDKRGKVWLIGTSFCYEKFRYAKWEWGDPIAMEQTEFVASGPNKQTWPQ